MPGDFGQDLIDGAADNADQAVEPNPFRD